MGMTCSLSPLVYAELYRLIAATADWQDAVDERLDNGGLYPEWLATAAEKYDAKWIEQATASDPYLVGDEHAELASWILASLRLKKPSTAFSQELRDRILNRYRSEVDAGAGQSPEGFLVAVVSWTLGKVIGRYDVDLPVVPARLPVDDAVGAAYEGLVQHIVHLGEVREVPWPEMLGTSTYWRGAGIAEAMQPDQEKLSDAIGWLVSGSRPHLEERDHDLIRKHWQGPFITNRNVVTHVRTDRGTTFESASGTAGDKQAIRPTLLGITQFVFQQVSEELANQSVRTELGTLWDNKLVYDVEVY